MITIRQKPKTQKHIESMRSRIYDKSFMQSEEYRSKMSIAVSGKNNGMYGKTHSKEVKEKLSLLRTKTFTLHNVKTGEIKKISNPKKYFGEDKQKYNLFNNCKQKNKLFEGCWEILGVTQ